MNELYALEAKLRAEINRLVGDMRELRAPYGMDAYLVWRRVSAFRVGLSFEHGFTFEWVDPPSFEELWEMA